MTPIRVVIVGATGRMGRMLVQQVLQDDRAVLHGVTVRPEDADAGQDLGTALGGAALGIRLETDPLPLFVEADAVIDFTLPEATMEHATLAAQARLVHVIGTTGFDRDHLAHLKAAARHATIIRAGNMSLGVNLLTALTQQVAAALGEEYDIEIIEAHHNQKADAPSGTALMLGEAAAEGRGRPLTELEERGRDGITGARQRGRIGFSAIRGGDIIGEHDVLFAGAGERITLRHVASDRQLFARGALRAVHWGIGKKPGEYSMQDVLGL